MASTATLPSDHTFNPSRRKRSFTLVRPSFRKTAAEAQQLSSVQDTASAPSPTSTSTTTAAAAAAAAQDQKARIRKAAAWQWYTRSVGEVVAPTTLRSAIRSTSSADATVADVAALQPQHNADSITNKPKPVLLMSKNVPQSPGHRSSVAAASRFKVEANASGTGAAAHGPARPAATPSAGPPPARTPLYDEFDLSGLKIQMADFVERLQQKPPQLKTKPQHSDSSSAPKIALAVDDQCHPPAARLATPGAEGLGLRRPMAVLRRLFRKIVSFPKNSTVNRPVAATVPPDCEEPPDDPEDVMQYHYHHYIHHHHHHYHYGPSPEQMDIHVRRRRNSESSGIHSRVSSSVWENPDAVDEEEEGRPISALPARRKRYSDSAFAAAHNSREKAAPTGTGSMEKPATKLAELQRHRRHNSDRFTSGNKQPNDVAISDVEVTEGEEAARLWRNADIKGRTRHWTESFREGVMGNVRNIKAPGLVEVEEKPCISSAKAGVYKLGGAHDAGGRGRGERPGAVIRRRQSESELSCSRQVERIVVQQEVTNVKNVGGSSCQLYQPARRGGGTSPAARQSYHLNWPQHPPRQLCSARPPQAAFLQRQPRPSSATV